MATQVHMISEALAKRNRHPSTLGRSQKRWRRFGRRATTAQRQQVTPPPYQPPYLYMWLQGSVQLGGSVPASVQAVAAHGHTHQA